MLREPTRLKPLELKLEKRFVKTLDAAALKAILVQAERLRPVVRPRCRQHDPVALTLTAFTSECCAVGVKRSLRSCVQVQAVARD